MEICNKKTQVFKVLKTLPFFKALYNSDLLEGFVLFNPLLETASFLVSWLEFRTPGSRDWSSELSKEKLDRAVLREMILHGTWPALGMFVDWDISAPSLAFLAAWLAWHGIVPSPDMNVAFRSELWWRSAAKSQLELVRTKPRNIRVDSASIKLLVSAAATTRAVHGRLLESFELFDEGLATLSPSNFQVLLRTLATVHFTENPALRLSSESPQLLEQGEHAWNIARNLSALGAGVATSNGDVKIFMRARLDKVTATLAHIASDPRSSCTANSSFYLKHGVDIAVNKAKASKIQVPYLVNGRAYTTDFSDAIGWRDEKMVIAFSLAALESDPISTGLAFSKLLTRLRAKRSTKESNDILPAIFSFR